MNRTMILVASLTGAAGLAVGWLASGPGAGNGPSASRTHQTLKPTPEGAGASPPAPGRHEFAMRPEDVANDRETPALAADGAGRVVLAWASQSGEAERTVYLARSGDGGKTFGPPSAFRKVPVFRFTSTGKGRTMAFSTHVLPRLVSAADGLHLGWVEAVNGGPEVAFFVARSDDGGATFSAPARVHGGGASRPGFTTLSAAPDGTLVAAWIDARNRAQQPFFAAKPGGSEGFGPERLVFAGPDGKGICPCCDLAATRLPDGSDVVAFRNSDSGHRDIWVSRAPSGGDPFAPPAPISAETWTFEGCPHDGPSLALTGDRLNAVWMSAHSGRNRVYAADSPVSELSFHPRELSPETPGAQGHPKLAAAGDSLYAVWDESLDAAAAAPPDAGEGGHDQGHGHGHAAATAGSGRAVMVAGRSGGGRGFGPAVPVSPRPGAFQLNPAVAVGSDGAVLVAWAETDTSGKRVVFVRREPAEGAR